MSEQNKVPHSSVANQVRSSAGHLAINISPMRRRLLQKLTTLTLAVMPLLLVTGCCGEFFRGSKDIVGLTVSPTGASIQPKTTQQFTATGTYTDSSTGDVTPETTWSSSDPTIATIKGGGLATGVSVGVTTISGSCQCYTQKTNLTISTSAANLTSIAVTPADQAVDVGSSQQYTATGTYSNGSTSVITSSVSWTSSSNTIATVNSTGLATGVAIGSTMITAASNGVSGNTTLTVQ